MIKNKSAQLSNMLLNPFSDIDKTPLWIVNISLLSAISYSWAQTCVTVKVHNGNRCRCDFDGHASHIAQMYETTLPGGFIVGSDVITAGAIYSFL